MILLLVHGTDPGGPALARAVSHRRPARLVTPRDLSRPGWQLACPADGDGVVVAGGVAVPQHAVDLVCCLISAVSPDELAWIEPADRKYVAAEGTAFLRHWLATSPCLVPPSSECLAGPARPVERWAEAGGVPVAPERAAGASDRVEACVAGGRVVSSDAPPAAGSAALRMARDAGIPLLRAVFRIDGDATAALVGASPVPSLAPPAVRARLAGLILAAA